MIVVGAGFGGLEAARSAAGAGCRVTVVDRNHHTTFQPLLYQVATAGLDIGDVASPVRAALRGVPGVRVLRDTGRSVDPDRPAVVLERVGELTGDLVVVAAGAAPATYGVPGVGAHALTLTTVGDAIRLRDHLLDRLERASAGDPTVNLDVVVVGGGPTGVELAGAVAELFRRVLPRDYPGLDLASVAVHLLEAGDRLLPAMSEASGRDAAAALTERGVTVRTAAPVAAVDGGGVELAGGGRVDAGTVIWAAGVTAAGVGAALGLPSGRGGRVPVRPTLQLPDHPRVLVIGDLAGAPADPDRPDGPLLAQLAPVAMQQGRHVGRVIRALRSGGDPPPFRYRDRGTMATIGRRAAVADLRVGDRSVHLAGTPAWLAWLGLHLLYLAGGRNRASVLVDWAWAYLTWGQGPRVIVSEALADRQVPGTVPR